MIVKNGSGGYKSLMEGIEIKNMAHGDHTHLTKFRLQKGAVIPEHRHPHEQTGYLLSGKLKFFGDIQPVIAEPGDCWTLAGGTVHGAEALEDSVVLECFSQVREDYLEMERSKKG